MLCGVVQSTQEKVPSRSRRRTLLFGSDRGVVTELGLATTQQKRGQAPFLLEQTALGEEVVSAPATMK